jgi:chromosomal replication initiation ATPase DnaA
MAGGEQWAAVLAEVERRLPRRSFEAWFREDTVLNVTRKGNRLTVLVADEWARAYMEDVFTVFLQGVVFEVTGRGLAVVFAAGQPPAKKSLKNREK